MGPPVKDALVRFGSIKDWRILETAQWIPRSRNEVFAFFSDAHNLESITPPMLRFEVLSRRPIEMRAGLLIDYRIRLRGLPLRWQSEITAWKPPHRFVDEQRRGPYRAWIHEHRFEDRDGGTLVTDRVRYRVLGGAVVDRLVVRRDLRAIFQYRRKRLEELLPWAGSLR